MSDALILAKAFLQKHECPEKGQSLFAKMSITFDKFIKNIVTFVKHY